jgi:hypothetical protein
LLKPILRRSATEFASCLRFADPNDLLTALADIDILRALSSWPQGVKILVCCETVNRLTISDLWSAVIQSANPDSILALLSYGVNVTFQDWSQLLYIINKLMYEDVELYSEYTSKYGLILLQMAGALSPSIDTEATLHNLDTTLYHTPHLGLAPAECLWISGRQNMDEVGVAYGQYPWHNSEPAIDVQVTPLWIVSRYSLLKWKDFWAVVKWLIERDANVHWISPILTTPAHEIIAHARCAAIYSSSIRPIIDTEAILLDCPPDGCTCYCSQQGCNGIGYIFRTRRTLWQYYACSRAVSYRYHKIYVVPHLLHLVDDNPRLTWMGPAILRMWTFDKLALTHTCCAREEIASTYARFSDRYYCSSLEEKEEIHDIERADIDELEELMTEFEVAWAAFPNSFVKFITEVWKPRMREIRKSRRKDPERYRQDVRKLGVKLNEDFQRTFAMDISDEEDTDSDRSGENEDTGSE